MVAEQSERIKLWGIVQGVGFRPYVAKTAALFHMKGQVLNIGGLVEIIVTDTSDRISDFLDFLIKNKPAPAEIVHIKREHIEYRAFDSFTIIKSSAGDDEAAMLPSDLAICPDCLKELYEKNNPRYQHPFISCMVCGPRYTIIDRIPYDRENTSMVDFPMCGFCEKQYTDLEDRRHHAQTISCHDCGPQLLWKDRASLNHEFHSDKPKVETSYCTSGCVDSGSPTDADQTADSSGSDFNDTTSGFSTNNAAAPQNHRSACKDGAQTASPKLRTSAESISCNIPKSEYTAESARLRNSALLDHAAGILQDGGIIAFKSGYNLVADPLNDEAVAKLRTVKNRESKPFAVMFRNMEQIKEFCYVSEAEENLLNSSARPIILLEHKELPYEEIKKSRFIGSFLPSLAAQYMLLDRVSPLIFTSANLSDMPMIKDEAEMMFLMEENPYIEGMLYNERQIRVRADDSVVRVIDGQPQMIRRSKGYAPVPLYIDLPKDDTADEALKDGFTVNKTAPAADFVSQNDNLPSSAPTMILAAGSQLKNSFALTKGPFTYISQFFGDMDTVENQKLYEENIGRLKALFRIEPDAVACDLHPLYFTTAFAEKYAEENGIPLIRVQHHHAHVASVMAENDLKGKVIGVSFDGTGYGEDGCIWGGEFFICEGGHADRIAHLKYVDMLGGDSSVKDARRSALSYIYAFDHGYLKARGRFEEELMNGSEIENEDKRKTTDNESRRYAPNSMDSIRSTEIAVDISDIVEFGRENLLSRPDSKLIMSALDSGINTVKSSSMGRLFDGVSAMLDIKEYNDYEGQCAIMLEDAAAFALKSPGEDKRCDLALSFHRRIADMIVLQCLSAREKYGVHQVALTGGTFQNKLLMEDVLEKLRTRGFEVYYNISVSPNDGGIALGQAYIAMHTLSKK